MSYFNHTLHFLAIAAGLLSGATSYAGGSVSGGGGADYRVDSKAWFTTSDRAKKVSVCIESTAEFGFSKSSLKLLTENAFNTWAKYYKESGGLDAVQGQVDQCLMNGEMRKGYRIATEVVVSEFCTGHEDLVVYFGVENPDLQQRIEKFYRPFGFAELVKPLDPSKQQDAWSPGMIWIAPTLKPDVARQNLGLLWSNFGGAPLEMLLLHEMGHAFGNDHIEHTIMGEDVGNILATYTVSAYENRRHESFEKFLKVDRQNFLVYHPKDYPAMAMSPPDASCELMDESCQESHRELYQNDFALLTGTSLRGNYFEVSLDRLPEVSREFRKPLKLTFKADGESFDIPFQPFSIDLDLWTAKPFNEGCRWKEQHVYSVRGDLLLKNGQKKEVTLNINVFPTKVEIVDSRMEDSGYCAGSYSKGHCVLLKVKY